VIAARVNGCPVTSREDFGLLNKERQRLQLHFSKNMIDWCFAGTVSPKESRHYLRSSVSFSMIYHLLSRACDPDAKRIGHDSPSIAAVDKRIMAGIAALSGWESLGEEATTRDKSRTS